MSNREQRAASRAGRREEEEEDATVTAPGPNDPPTHDEIYTLLKEIRGDVQSIRRTQNDQANEIAAIREAVNRIQAPGLAVPERPRSPIRGPSRSGPSKRGTTPLEFTIPETKGKAKRETRSEDETDDDEPRNRRTD